MDTQASGSPALAKTADQFRDYVHARPGVEEFYRLNHLAREFFPDPLRW